MKPSAWMFSTSLFLAASAHAATADQLSQDNKPPGWQPAPTTISEWADRCTDTTVNGWGFKDPKNFVKLAELFSDPAIYLEFAKRMQDPESYARIAGRMLDPATLKNYLEWSDPVIYARWSQAFTDPNFLAAAMRPLTDVSTYMRWLALPTDQRAWSVGANMLNPGMWLKWMTAGASPKVLETLAKAEDPNTAAKWLRVASDPDNFKLARVWALPPPSPLPGVNFPPFNPGAWYGTSASTTAPARGVPKNGEGAKP